jgi:protoporphyrinogen/coproporphyrinogen III oxidase
LATIQKIQHTYPGLIIAGGIRDGIGMADRMKQAKTIADEILAGRSHSEPAVRYSLT